MPIFNQQEFEDYTDSESEVESEDSQSDNTYELAISKEMAEAQRRLIKGGFYQNLANRPIFPPDSKEALEINEEIKVWALQKVLELLNGKKPNKQEFTDNESSILKKLASFTDQEIAALKTLAAKVMGQPLMMTPSPMPIPQPTPQPLPQPTPALSETKPETKKPRPPQNKPQKEVKQKVKQPAPLPEALPFPRGAALMAANLAIAQEKERLRSDNSGYLSEIIEGALLK